MLPTFDQVLNATYYREIAAVVLTTKRRESERWVHTVDGERANTNVGC